MDRRGKRKKKEKTRNDNDWENVKSTTNFQENECAVEIGFKTYCQIENIDDKTMRSVRAPEYGLFIRLKNISFISTFMSTDGYL